MRPSRVLRKLREGKPVSSFKANLSDPRVFDLIASYGFDCIWTCLEHVPNDLSSIETAALITKSYDVDLLCRTERGSYSDYVRPLEADSSGIMVPHIMSLEDAKSVISMTRFPPVGRRPADGGNADGKYCRIPFTDYIRQANRERFVVFQIEDPEPLKDLDKICELEGFDILFFGPGDYSLVMGCPGELNHPEVQRVRELVVETAHKHGKFAGTVAGTANYKEIRDMGYDFINVGADVVGLSAYCAEVAKVFGITETESSAGYYSSAKL